jgi:hypothetical protein
MTNPGSSSTTTLRAVEVFCVEAAGTKAVAEPTRVRIEAVNFIMMVQCGMMYYA